MVKQPQLFKGQKYAELYKQYKSLDAQFTDSLFPATKSSLGAPRHLPENVQWKRPGSICESPRLFGTDGTTSVVTHGQSSSNYFVSACSILGGISELVHQVIPDHSQQEWDPEKPDKYIGLFHFRFWRFGQWVDVVIDDLLPTVDNELIFTRASHKDEFWSALLEKAYAKLHGSYEALEGGHITDALVDFTGGVSEVLDLNNEDYAGDPEKLSSLFELMLHEFSNHSVMCCTITNRSPTHNTSSFLGSRNEMGLYQGHAYAITHVKKIHLGETTMRTLFKGREKCFMVRLRDPRGEGSKSVPQTAPQSAGSTKEDAELTADTRFAYSTSHLTRLLSKSTEWAQIKDSERQRLGLLFDNEGEFWMPLEDFVSNFSELAICRLYASNLFTVSRPWQVGCVRGVWSAGAKGTPADRAGGGVDYPDTYLRNPQYVFHVRGVEEEVAVQMLQWDSDQHVQHIAMQKHLISFLIIKVEENRKYRMHRQWEYCPTVVCLDHVRKREIFYRGYLKQGRYIIIPTANKPGELGNFVLRLFTYSNINLRQLDTDVPKHHWYYSCCSKYPELFTVVSIRGAEGLMKVNRFGSCDPYCIIKCEGETFKTPVARNTREPLWNCAFIFLRKNIEKPIEIQVFSHNVMLRDTFVGEVKLPALVNQHPSLLRAELKHRNSDVLTEGNLVLDVLTDDYLMAL